VFFLVAATILPIGVMVTTDLWNSRASAPAADAVPATLATGRHAAIRPRPAKRSVPRWVVVVATVLSVGVASVSLTDWWAFYQSDVAKALMVTDSPKDKVITDLALQSAEDHPGTLIMVDFCIDPRVLKVTSGVPVAYYHLGMAWPTEYDAVATIVSARLGGNLDRDAAIKANATQVLTDSECGDYWNDRYAADLEEQASAPYTDAEGKSGTITLWGLRER
jgi:hypothetical protein